MSKLAQAITAKIPNDRDDTRMHTLLAELENKMFVEGL